MRTPAEMQEHLTNDQLKLYTLIWNRVVASQMTDAVYDVTTLTMMRLRAGKLAAMGGTPGGYSVTNAPCSAMRANSLAFSDG